MENTVTETQTEQTALEKINNTIKSLISESKQKVTDIIVEKFVIDEINRRADLLARLVTAINNYSKEQYKIKADLLSYDEKGTVLREEWSKTKLEEKKKFNEKLNKAQKAFENALEKNDYSNLENIIKELSVKSKDTDEPKKE